MTNVTTTYECKLTDPTQDEDFVFASFEAPTILALVETLKQANKSLHNLEVTVHKVTRAKVEVVSATTLTDLLERYK